MSTVNAIYHIVINTKSRKMTLPPTSCDSLYRYMGRIIANKNCILYSINGIENHVHLLINLHPTVSLADLVRDLKLSTSQWIKTNINLFPMFEGWGKEYGAFSYALRDRQMVSNYIANQREHHKRETFEEEYRKHVERAGLEWNEYRLT